MNKEGRIFLGLTVLLAASIAILFWTWPVQGATAPPKSTATFGKKQAQVHTAARTTPPFVPFLRVGELNMKGCKCPSVFQMQRALKAAGVRPQKMKATGYYRKPTAHQVALFQKKVGIPASGRYGLRTHKALSKYYDKPGRARLISVQAARRTAAIIKATKTITTHAWHYRYSMWYSQSASRGILPSYPGVPRATDCSGYVTWVYKSLGLPDPNGFNYHPVGYTGTLARHGVRVSALTARVGDLVFYGGGWPHGHVAIVVATHPTLVSSHGSPGIAVVPINYRPVSEVRRYF